MVNHWIEKKNRNDRLEEAQQALQRWCNKTSYDEFGMYIGKKVLNWDKPLKAKQKFFREYPEYQEFDMELRVTWNMHHEEHPTKKTCGWAVSDCHGEHWPNDATGIPEVTHYPEGYWERCAEIAKRAKGNYFDHKEERVCNWREGTYQAWVGDKIAKAITKQTHRLYLRHNGIYDESVDAEKHLLERQRKFWRDN